MKQQQQETLMRSMNSEFEWTDVRAGTGPRSRPLVLVGSIRLFSNPSIATATTHRA